MDIKQEIIDSVIYSGSFDTIRGIIAELGLAAGNINKTDFTGAIFWEKGEDQFAVAYSSNVMVMNKNDNLHGVAKYASAAFPLCSEDDFSLGGGAISLANGML